MRVDQPLRSPDHVFQPGTQIGAAGAPASRPAEPKPIPASAHVSATTPAASANASAGGPAGGVSKIQMFEQRTGAKRHEDKWSRSPNSTGTGAIHCKSFHCKLVGDSLEFLDQQINEWLDAHPQYEVKFVTSSIGEWTGKQREPNLIIQVWV